MDVFWLQVYSFCKFVSVGYFIVNHGYAAYTYIVATSVLVISEVLNSVEYSKF